MRSISPWLLPRCSSLAFEPTPRRESLVHFRSLLSTVGWLAGVTSPPVNSIKRGKGSTSIVAVVVLTWFLTSPFAMGQTKQTVDDGLKASKISLVLEGVGQGKSIRLLVTNITDSRVALVLPKGNSDFDVGRYTVTISTERELSIDLQGQKSFEVILPQVGKRARLQAGKITLKQTEKGMLRQFENATFGPAS